MNGSDGLERDRLEIPGKRRVQNFEHKVALPGGEPERHEEGRGRDDQARAQLAQMVDDRQLFLVMDGPNARTG